jgi:hypothetical protein
MESPLEVLRKVHRMVNEPRLFTMQEIDDYIDSTDLLKTR